MLQAKIPDVFLNEHVKGAAFAAAVARDLETRGFCRTDIDDMDFLSRGYEFDIGYPAGGDDLPFATLIVRPQKNACHRFVTMNFRSNEAMTEKTCDIYMTADNALSRQRGVLPPLTGILLEQSLSAKSITILKRGVLPEDIDAAMNARYSQVQKVNLPPTDFLKFIDRLFSGPETHPSSL